jgi:O-antigen/teichoic acid export membrane protein
VFRSIRRRTLPRSSSSDPGQPDSLAGDASGALVWSFVNTAVSRFGTLGIGIVLARLLGPQEFGTYAVAYVALVAVLSFNELGVSLAIVRWPGDPRAIAPTVNTISLISSSLIAVVGYLIAPWFATAMGDPSATQVVRLLGLSVIVSGAVATPAALLQREFRQDTRMLIDQVNVWVGALTSIGLAVAGSGAMSLAVGRLAGAAASGVMFLRFCPEPYRFGWNRKLIKPLLRFGLPLAGASIVVFAVGYADQLAVGRILGPTALGFYVLAFNLSSWPVSMFSLPLRSVAPPTFARLQHEPRTMRSALRSLIGLLAALAFPACLLLCGAAGPLIHLVYGPAWAPAAQALAWLAVLAAFKIMYELAYDYLVVVGVSGSILMLQLTSLVALVPALVFGAKVFGIQGVAAAQVLVAAVVVLPLYLVLFWRSGVAPLALLGRVWLPATAAGLVALTAVVLSDVLGSNLLAVLLSGLVTLAVIGLLLLRDRDRISQLRNLRSPAAIEQEVPV